MVSPLRPLILANRDVNDVLSFLSSVVNVLWEKEMPELLTEFLTRKEFEMLVKHVDVRSKLISLLMRSCRKEKDFDSPMVRVLIKHDCRLNLSTNETVIESESLRYVTNSLYIRLQELRIISFSVVNMTEKSQSLMVRNYPNLIYQFLEFYNLIFNSSF